MLPTGGSSIERFLPVVSNFLSHKPGSNIGILSIMLVGVDEARPDDLVARLVNLRNINPYPHILAK